MSNIYITDVPDIIISKITLHLEKYAGHYFFVYYNFIYFY